MYGGIIAVGYTIFTTSLIGNKIDEDNKKQALQNLHFQNQIQTFETQVQNLEKKIVEQKEESNAYMATSIVGMGLAFGLGIMSAWKRN
jgi:hypothetical protein